MAHLNFGLLSRVRILWMVIFINRIGKADDKQDNNKKIGATIFLYSSTVGLVSVQIRYPPFDESQGSRMPDT